MNPSAGVPNSSAPGPEPIPPMVLVYTPLVPVYMIPTSMPMMPPPLIFPCCPPGRPDTGRLSDSSRSGMTSDSSTVVGEDAARPPPTVVRPNSFPQNRDPQAVPSNMPMPVRPPISAEECGSVSTPCVDPLAPVASVVRDGSSSPVSFSDLDPMDLLFRDIEIPEPLLSSNAEPCAPRPNDALPSASIDPEPSTSSGSPVRAPAVEPTWKLLLYEMQNP
ncbi:hypothetical protein QAD02_019828 [Eretmocerus hayati]|uniref:Uncharacterized protein n=2 Tax=Eretmocerus hayati TaxID=131215 RepID=A0ACC2NHY0_9HYME|nr:hypothetical protein QAD02_001956 [Eretmocerus hayati]KAJ8684036.1 hypothetical protein QAD02_019828 [Eretmocerus hayati]